MLEDLKQAERLVSTRPMDAKQVSEILEECNAAMQPEVVALSGRLLGLTDHGVQTITGETVLVLRIGIKDMSSFMGVGMDGLTEHLDLLLWKKP